MFFLAFDNHKASHLDSKPATIIEPTQQHQQGLSTAFSPGRESHISYTVHGPPGPPGGSCGVALWETNLRKKRKKRHKNIQHANHRILNCLCFNIVRASFSSFDLLWPCLTLTCWTFVLSCPPTYWCSIWKLRCPLNQSLKKDCSMLQVACN